MNEALISHDGPGHLWLASLGMRGMDLGLQRIHAILARLERPDHAYASIVVAGTDGKGSTSAMVTQLLAAAGLRVGHYTSPHLLETRERIRIDDACVTAEALDLALLAVREVSGRDLDPTPFEALTAAGLLLFREAGVQVAVLEVGLGGRLDAVNATEPVLSVITHLSHDHMAVLGSTLAQIAFEKTGVAREGRPLIVAQAGLVKSALRKHDLTPRLLSLGQDAVVESYALRGPAWHAAGVVSGPDLPSLDVELALAGRHQMDNAVLAILAYRSFAQWWQQDRGETLADVDEVVPALAELDWPCRAEVIEVDPTVVLDAAHNPAGVEALAQLLSERGRQWQVILAVRKDRDATEVVRALAPIAHTFWLPRMTGPTLMDAEELSLVVDEIAPGASVAVSSAARCVTQARREVGKIGGVVLTGSQHALGEWLGLGSVQSPRLVRRLRPVVPTPPGV
jgi:dihydrofolate synthase/folylpolyglutamate synthase